MIIINGDSMNSNNENLKNEKNIEYTVQTREIADKIIRMLVEERKRQGFTQQDIADDTGMRASNVTRFESCKNTPTLEILTRYADALGKKLQIELIDK